MLQAEKWVPELGRLVIRRIVRPAGWEEIELNYRDLPEDDIHHMTIAELRHDAAKACCAGHIEFVDGQELHTSVGDFCRRYALDEDLDRIVACWRDQFTSCEAWLAGLRRHDSQLLEEEKARIERAIARHRQQ